MKNTTFILGNTYFRLTFADPDMTMPAVEPFVYVGKHDSEGEMRYTFQDTISYMWVGCYPGPFIPDQNIEVALYPMKDEDAPTMFSFEELFVELTEIAARAKKLGFPNLEPAPAAR